MGSAERMFIAGITWGESCGAAAPDPLTAIHNALEAEDLDDDPRTHSIDLYLVEPVLPSSRLRDHRILRSQAADEDELCDVASVDDVCEDLVSDDFSPTEFSNGLDEEVSADLDQRLDADGAETLAERVDAWCLAHRFTYWYRTIAQTSGLDARVGPDGALVIESELPEWAGGAPPAPWIAPAAWTTVTAACVLFRSADDPSLVLAVPRRDSDHLCLPGGKVEPGEEPEAAALREAKEETGVIGSRLRYVGSAADYIDPEHVRYETHVFIGEPLPRDVELVGEPGLAPTWVTAAELLERSPFAGCKLAIEASRWSLLLTLQQIENRLAVPRGEFDLSPGEFDYTIAAYALRTAMSEISEETWCAAWEDDLGSRLWSYIAGRAPTPTSLGWGEDGKTANRERLARVRMLAQACGWWWADYQYAVPLDEWQHHNGWIGGVGMKRKLGRLGRLRRRETFLERTATQRRAKDELVAVRWAIEELAALYPDTRSTT